MDSDATVLFGGDCLILEESILGKLIINTPPPNKTVTFCWQTLPDGNALLNLLPIISAKPKLYKQKN